MNVADRRVLLEHTTSIVAAYVSNNTIQKEHLAALIADVFTSLAGANRAEPEPEALTPAVPVKRSVQADHIVCLEDGKKFKSLKRHLMTHYNMTPEDYRAKWGLPADYPMVAPNYALARSTLAKKDGAGPAHSRQHRGGGAPASAGARQDREPEAACRQEEGGRLIRWRISVPLPDCRRRKAGRLPLHERTCLALPMPPSCRSPARATG